MNDSLEYDVLVSESEMIGHGLKIGASHVLICLDHDGSLEPEFVFDDRRDRTANQDIGAIEKACWRSSFSVNTIDLNALRKAEALS